MHVGIIPDGMRRWAHQNQIDKQSSYLKSLEKIKSIIDLFFENQFTSLSVYSLSKDNIKRSEDDLQSVLFAETLFFEKYLPAICQKWNCRFSAIGNYKQIGDQRFENAILHLEKITAHFEHRNLYAIINYNAMEDISKYKNLESLNQIHSLCELSSIPEPLDMVVRTGGENRLSDFLPLNLGYSEIYFIDKFFLDVEIEDYIHCLNDFRTTQRRFGV